MVLVNEALGYRVCLECHEVFVEGDEHAWLAVHLGPDGCQVVVDRRRRRGRRGRRPRD